MSRFASRRSRGAGDARRRTSTMSSACRRARGHESSLRTRTPRSPARSHHSRATSRGRPVCTCRASPAEAAPRWNARARFPGASTMKLAIAAAVLARHTGIPAPGSQVSSLLSSMLTHSDNASANALEVWLGGSTSGGLAARQRADALDRHARLRDVRRLRASHPCGAYSGSRRAAARIRLRQAHDSLGHRDAPTRGLARFGRPRAASRRAAWLHRCRRPLPPLAPRARQRRAEARSRSRTATPASSSCTRPGG